MRLSFGGYGLALAALVLAALALALFGAIECILSSNTRPIETACLSAAGCCSRVVV